MHDGSYALHSQSAVVHTKHHGVKAEGQKSRMRLFWPSAFHARPSYFKMEMR